jgi:polyhydroxyalkanoate synthase
MAAMSYASSNAALPLLSSGSLSWSPTLGKNAAGLRKDLASVDGAALAAAVDREGRRRLGVFLSGVERYRVHPYRRDLEYPPAVWAAGTTRLYDYGRDRAKGPPVLIIPSLINRAYILDLSSRRSFVRWFANQGVWPFLLDWDAPGAAERGFTLTDYIRGRLEPALECVAGLTGERPVVAGYCMGGLLAAALVQRRVAEVRGLALLATPWDFHAVRAEQARGIAALAIGWEGIMGALGELPVDLLQVMFAALDPQLGERKFSAFAALDPDSDQARDFVALEDWVNDGVPLAAAVARECLSGWYGANSAASRQWRVDGQPVDPAALDLPALAIIPQNDRIVPPRSALALADAMPRASRLSPAAGHIGMMVGRGVDETVWRPMLDWLKTLP